MPYHILWRYFGRFLNSRWSLLAYRLFKTDGVCEFAEFLDVEVRMPSRKYLPKICLVLQPLKFYWENWHLQPLGWQILADLESKLKTIGVCQTFLQNQLSKIKSFNLGVLEINILLGKLANLFKRIWPSFHNVQASKSPSFLLELRIFTSPALLKWF